LWVLNMHLHNYHRPRRGTPCISEGPGCSSENSNKTLKETDLGMAQAFVYLILKDTT